MDIGSTVERFVNNNPKVVAAAAGLAALAMPESPSVPSHRADPPPSHTIVIPGPLQEVEYYGNMHPDRPIHVNVWEAGVTWGGRYRCVALGAA